MNFLHAHLIRAVAGAAGFEDGANRFLDERACLRRRAADELLHIQYFSERRIVQMERRVGLQLVKQVVFAARATF